MKHSVFKENLILFQKSIFLNYVWLLLDYPICFSKIKHFYKFTRLVFLVVSGQVSRDQSPRIFLNSESGTAKMKRPVARHHPNRNSANLGSSTLQEDLLKLIGPDFDPTPRTVSRQNSKVKSLKKCFKGSQNKLSNPKGKG
jgi:hypothetical protein